MCTDLVKSREEAKLLKDSNDCPVKENGWKAGIMELTLKFWNEKGYEYLEKSAQNLRDKSAYLERTCKIDATQIHNELQEQREKTEQDINNNIQQEYAVMNENPITTATKGQML